MEKNHKNHDRANHNHRGLSRPRHGLNRDNRVRRRNRRPLGRIGRFRCPSTLSPRLRGRGEVDRRAQNKQTARVYVNAEATSETQP